MEPIDILSEQEKKWSLLHKIIFRFFAAYILIYIFPFLSLFPLVAWVGKHILHISYEISTESSGSGDTTYKYVQEFMFIVLAFVIAILWSLLDRRRGNYKKLLYWATALSRYYLAFFLLVYGSSKFNHGQFPQPSLFRLMQPYGESSPMGLAWTFFGYSTGYGIFMGISECMGGLLMLFRRTALFGACIATAVVMNIFMVNLFYDVPVKLFSANLLLLSMFVLFSEGRRFFDFFIFNKAIAPLDTSPAFNAREWRIARIVAKALLMAIILGVPVASLFKKSAYTDPKSPLYGTYVVESFVYKNDTLPPVKTDSIRWDKIAFMDKGFALVYKMNDSVSWQKCTIDTGGKTLILEAKNNNLVYSLSYCKQQDNLLCLAGTVINGDSSSGNYDSVSIKVRRIDEQKFLLTNRGFHWINEYPFNR